MSGQAQKKIDNLQLTSFFCGLKIVLHHVDICRIEAACAAHPTADVFINFASFRRSVLS